jgi:hypothetical protein
MYARYIRGGNSYSKDMVIVFVSSDSDEASFAAYYKDMTWVSVPFENRDAKTKLAKKYGVSGIPMLVVTDTNGDIIVPNARADAQKSTDLCKLVEEWSSSSAECKVDFSSDNDSDNDSNDNDSNDNDSNDNDNINDVNDLVKALEALASEGGLFEALAEMELSDVFNHPHVRCDMCSMCPIVGIRYHKVGTDYDLCGVDYAKLTDAEKAKYQKILAPDVHFPQ